MKKSFLTGMEASPAYQIIKAEPREREPEQETTERKTRRVQFLLTPSSVEQAKKICYMRKTSLNDAIQQLINSYISENQKAINHYDNIFPEG